jgi:hypothetical protein
MGDIKPTQGVVPASTSVTVGRSASAEDTRLAPDSMYVPSQWKFDGFPAVVFGTFAAMGLVAGGFSAGFGIGKRTGHSDVGGLVGALTGLTVAAGLTFGVGRIALDKAPIAPPGSSVQTVRDAQALYDAAYGFDNSSTPSRTDIRNLVEQIRLRGWPEHRALVEAATFATDGTSTKVLMEHLVEVFGPGNVSGG